MGSTPLALRSTIAVLLVLGVNPSAHAIDFVGKIALGNKSQELIIRDREFTPEYITLDLSLTGTIDRYFLTLNREVSIKDDIEPDGNGLIFYSREDTNLTFGYGFDIATVFVGFRKGETDANHSGQANEFGTKSEGFYIGASKSHYFKDKGSLSVSIAVANLDGEVTLSEPFVDTSTLCGQPSTAPCPGGGQPPPAVIGSATGISVAIGWSGQVTPDTIYNIDYKINQYDFEDDVVFGGVDLSYEENFSTYYIGLTHFFE